MIGSGASSCPGTIPAESDTCWPISVPSPIEIRCSPNTAPGGNASQLPSPNDANRRPRRESCVIAPAWLAHDHARCSASPSTRRARGPLNTAAP